MPEGFLLLNSKLSANDVKEIRAALKAAYQRGREDAARDVQTLVGYSYIGSAPLVGVDTAIAAARGDGEQYEQMD